MKKQYKYNKSFSTMKENICDTTCGLYPAPMPAQAAINILCDYLLGDDWYIVDSMGVEQCNAIIVEQILDKYSKQWRKDWKHFEKTEWESDEL